QPAKQQDIAERREWLRTPEPLTGPRFVPVAGLHAQEALTFEVERRTGKDQRFVATLDTIFTGARGPQGIDAEHSKALGPLRIEVHLGVQVGRRETGPVVERGVHLKVS